MVFFFFFKFLLEAINKFSKKSHILYPFYPLNFIFFLYWESATQRN